MKVCKILFKNIGKILFHPTTPSGEQEDTEWEGVFTTQKFIKEVVSGIYEELQVAKRKGRQSTDSWAEDLSGHFAEEAVQMAVTTA